MSVWCAWFLLVVLIGCTQTVNIGVVSSSPKDRLVLAAAAEAAISSVQQELVKEGKKPSPPEEDEEWQWEVLVAPVEAYESISIPEQVCAQVAQGVSAIVAHGAPQEIELTADAAARNGVPLLLVSPTALTVPPETLEQWEVVSMYPQPNIFIEVCAALCQEKAWSTAVLLHEGPVGSRLVEGIAEAGAETEILARRLPPMNDDSDEEALRNLLLILKKADYNRFIVWCDENCCDQVLAEAQRVGLLAERHAFILLALDMHTLDLEPYSHGGANITTLQLFDPVGEEVILGAWSEQYVKRLEPEEEDEDAKSVAQTFAEEVMNAPPTMLILTYDVVQHAARVLFRETIYSHTPADQNLACDPYRYLTPADTLINYLRSEDWDGAAAARRAGFLRVAELTRGGLLEPVAQWDRQSVLWSRNWTDDTPPAPGEMTNRTFVVLISLGNGVLEPVAQWDRQSVLWSRNWTDDTPPASGEMTNWTFLVVISLIKPYVMMKESSERLTGNERYEGFGIELIDKLSKMLNFNYTLLEDHGDYDTMLGHLNDPDVPGDFAITDLTITAKREMFVDFTTPFMNLGISILYKKPTAPDPKLFAFMLPFSTGVWFCLGLAYVGTSLVLYVIGRLCPEEWQNPYPCIEEPEALENQFTLANALWFNLGAVLLQGSEIAPVAYGSRAVASAWWLFALVITSSYTANLATLLAKKSNNDDFTKIEELANNQQGITYGAKSTGATYTFFNNSQDPLLRRMFEQMQKWEMPASNELGIERVKKEGESFAFFMESTSIEYTVQRECNLTQVGGLLDSKGYGIGMAKDSPYRQALNLALLKLQEAGELRAMKKKWWNEMHGGGSCNEAEEHENEKLTMKNFVGLFLVLGVGCVLGIFISLADLMLAARNKSRDPSATYWRRLGDEIRFVFHFQQSEKPVNGPLLPPPSPATEGIASEHLEEQEIEEEPERENIGSRMRSPSFQSNAPRSRRRSSLHNASVRLARHTRRESAAQNRVKHKESFDCEG